MPYHFHTSSISFLSSQESLSAPPCFSRFYISWDDLDLKNIFSAHHNSFDPEQLSSPLPPPPGRFLAGRQLEQVSYATGWSWANPPSKRDEERNSNVVFNRIQGVPHLCRPACTTSRKNTLQNKGIIRAHQAAPRKIPRWVWYSTVPCTIGDTRFGNFGSLWLRSRAADLKKKQSETEELANEYDEISPMIIPLNISCLYSILQSHIYDALHHPTLPASQLTHTEIMQCLFSFLGILCLLSMLLFFPRNTLLSLNACSLS